MSKIQVDEIVNKEDTGSPTLPKGVVVTGVATATSFSGTLIGNADTATNAQGLTGSPNITVNDVSATTVSIAGTLTYEDVTNVDSIGIITARTGINIVGGGATVTGIITARTGINIVGGGATVTGIATFLNGVDFNGLFKESIKINSGKLSDNLNINLDDGMVHYFLTTETATSTPNIMSGTGINTALSVGETLSVIIGITTGSYAAKVAIDGTTAGVSTYWNGGSAPDAAGDLGKDIYSYQVIKTADATYDVLANVTNFA